MQSTTMFTLVLVVLCCNIYSVTAGEKCYNLYGDLIRSCRTGWKCCGNQCCLANPLFALWYLWFLAAVMFMSCIMLIYICCKWKKQHHMNSIQAAQPQVIQTTSTPMYYHQPYHHSGVHCNHQPMIHHSASCPQGNTGYEQRQHAMIVSPAALAAFTAVATAQQSHQNSVHMQQSTTAPPPAYSELISESMLRQSRPSSPKLENDDTNEDGPSATEQATNEPIQNGLALPSLNNENLIARSSEGNKYVTTDSTVGRLADIRDRAMAAEFGPESQETVPKQTFSNGSSNDSESNNNNTGFVIGGSVENLLDRNLTADSYPSLTTTTQLPPLGLVVPKIEKIYNSTNSLYTNPDVEGTVVEAAELDALANKMEVETSGGINNFNETSDAKKYKGSMENLLYLDTVAASSSASLETNLNKTTSEIDDGASNDSAAKLEPEQHLETSNDYHFGLVTPDDLSTNTSSNNETPSHSNVTDSAIHHTKADGPKTSTSTEEQYPDNNLPHSSQQIDSAKDTDAGRNEVSTSDAMSSNHAGTLNV